MQHPSKVSRASSTRYKTTGMMYCSCPFVERGCGKYPTQFRHKHTNCLLRHIIVDALVSLLGHKKLKLHDFRRIIHKVLNISALHSLQRNTGLRSSIFWPHKIRWNKHELRSLENLSLITQHLHFVWVLFPEVHHFLTCFRSALRSTLDRAPKCCSTPRYQVIRQTWCSLIPYLSPGDATMLSMTRHVLLHLHRQMEATYALLTHDGSYFPKKKMGGVEPSFMYHQS